MQITNDGLTFNQSHKYYTHVVLGLKYYWILRSILYLQMHGQYYTCRCTVSIQTLPTRMHLIYRGIWDYVIRNPLPDYYVLNWRAFSHVFLNLIIQITAAATARQHVFMQDSPPQYSSRLLICILTKSGPLYIMPDHTIFAWKNKSDYLFTVSVTLWYSANIMHTAGSRRDGLNAGFIEHI